MTVYKRKLTAQLIKEINLPGIVILTGMRQVGKTTLMRFIFDTVETSNKIFLDLENPLYQKIFEEKNFDNIIANLNKVGLAKAEKAYVFLDEVQVAPGIVKSIKYLYDHYRIKFFLTGSSSYYLKNLFPESLAGRKSIYELFPLDFDEFLLFKNKERPLLLDFTQKSQAKNKVSYELNVKLFEEYLEFGGFPAVALAAEQERKKRLLEDIFTSYFEKDIRTLADFKETGKLRDLILLLSNRAGSKVEISKLSSELGVSRESIYAYLGFLEKTYFIFLLSPFSGSRDGEIRGAKKVYFCDTGLLNYLGKVSEGAALENAVFHNLRKYGQLNYYEKYSGAEIDFVLDGKVAFEVKITGNAGDIKKLERVTHKLKLAESYVVTKNYADLTQAILAQDL